MKVHLVVPALVLLQLVCPGSAKVLPRHVSELNEIYKLAVSSNATVPENLRNTSVPIMEKCDAKSFCQVQKVLLKFPENAQIQKLCRSLVQYNNHTHKKCTNAELQMTNDTVTNELQDLFIDFIECIRVEMISQPMGHRN
ncbi:unnamed protein product [Arctogadus glacialis]